MSVIKFTRHVARYRKGMHDRIEKRIQQLEEERNEVQIAVAMRMKEIEGAIQALRDVLTAMDNEAPKELAHVGS